MATPKSPRMGAASSPPNEKPKALKGFLQKRGPTAMTSWNRRWFVLEDNKLTYFKEQTDTQPVASVMLDELQSLQKSTDVAPKKTDPAFAFTLDVREGKDVRTYYLCAASESEKKQWIDTIVASRKYWAAVKGGALKASAQQQQQGPSACAEHEETIASLEAHNGSLRAQLDELTEDTERIRAQHDQELEALRETHRAELARARATPVASGRGAGPASPMVSGRGRGTATTTAKMALDDDDIPDFDSDDDRPVAKSGGGGGGGGGNSAELERKLKAAYVEMDELQNKLATAEETIVEQEQMISVLRAEAEEMAANLRNGGGGGGGGGDDEAATLREELEEVRSQAEDYKKKLLDLRVQYRKLETAAKK